MEVRKNRFILYNIIEQKSLIGHERLHHDKTKVPKFKEHLVLVRSKLFSVLYLVLGRIMPLTQDHCLSMLKIVR